MEVKNLTDAIAATVELTGNNGTSHQPSDEAVNNHGTLIAVTVIYALIFLSSVIGNTSTCLVIFRNRYMHTATNYYLFSLAVSDLLLVLSGLPKEVYELWFRYSYIFGDTSCIIQGFLSETAANATVLTITAFTVERYIAICYPFISYAVSKLSRALKHIIAIWIVALFLAIPQAIQFGVQESSGLNFERRTECTVKSKEMNAFVISSLLFFIVPMCIISVLYIQIGLHLRKSRRMKLNNSSKFTRASIDIRACRNQSRIIKMLVAVVVAFVICWAPFHAQRLMALYILVKIEEIKGDSWLVPTYMVLTHVSGIFYFLSTTVNPILYNIMSHKFRHAFKVTFGSLCGCQLSTGHTRKNTTSIVKNTSFKMTNQRLLANSSDYRRNGIQTTSFGRGDSSLIEEAINDRSLPDDLNVETTDRYAVNDELLSPTFYSENSEEKQSI